MTSSPQSSGIVINLALSASYIVTSGAMILFNASILKGYHPYPALLTTGHMVFSGSLAALLVWAGPAALPAWLPPDLVKLPPNMTRDLYVSAVLPIAGLQGLSLWLSNLAYIYINVSLIQMIKARSADRAGGGRERYGARPFAVDESCSIFNCRNKVQHVFSLGARKYGLNTVSHL